MTVPDEVIREVKALRDEIDFLVNGNWSPQKNVADSKTLRSKASDIVLAARKVENAVKRNTKLAYE